MSGVAVRRRLVLRGVPDAAGENLIRELLSSLPGVDSAEITASRLEIVYRLPEASLERLEAALDGSAVGLSRRWRDRLQRALIRYSEDCRLSALEAERRPPKACCNRPPK